MGLLNLLRPTAYKHSAVTFEIRSLVGWLAGWLAFQSPLLFISLFGFIFTPKIICYAFLLCCSYTFSEWIYGYFFPSGLLPN